MIGRNKNLYSVTWNTKFGRIFKTIMEKAFENR